ncbi:hypothetical protein [Streptomyces sp. YKOK-I1]
MRFKALTVAATAVGALALTAAPASAQPYWQAVDTNSNWSCTPYYTHKVSDNVKFKLCEVVNANYDAQVVVVVQNTASVAVTIAGAVDSSYGSSGSCYTSTLNSGFTRGCFGTTEDYSTSGWWIWGQVSVNGVADSITVTS